MAAHLVVAGDVFDGVLFCAVHFPHEMSSMRSGTELSQFLRIFLPTLQTEGAHANLLATQCSLYFDKLQKN